MPFSDTAKRVIDLATTIRRYWDAELPKRHPSYPLVKAGEDSGPPPPEEAELRGLLQSLPSEDLYKLLALMYLGRGDFNATGFESMVHELRGPFPDRDRVIRQMMSKGPLAEYLADGLHELADHGLDIDKVEAATT